MNTAIGLLIIALAGAAWSKEQPAAAPPATATPANSPTADPGLADVERKYVQALESRSSTERRELLVAAAAAHLPEAKAELAILAKDAGERERLAIEALSDGLATRAEKGKASAQRGLARLYEAGLGLPKDPAKAKDLYRQASAQGLLPARSGPAGATKEDPWENSLGMKFVSVAGTGVLFSIWETRVKDYAAFVEATGYKAMEAMYSIGRGGWGDMGRTWREPDFEQTEHHPVCGVNWKDAVAFCEWLTEEERKAGRLTASQTYRLPSDLEWSAAVGLDEEKGRTPQLRNVKVKGVYPWGTKWPPQQGAGNYAGSEAKTRNWHSGHDTIEGYRDEYARTAPVGSFEKNENGIFDLGGNVEEWCQDFWDVEAASWDAKFGPRVVRGASWAESDSDYMLSSRRKDWRPESRRDTVGFRCVLVVGSSR